MTTRNILSAGVVPFSKDKDGVRFLILRSFNYWDFPKGEVEFKEDPFKAALREMKEETCLKPKNFPFGHDYYETERYGQGKVARYYIGLVEGTPEIEIPVSEELGAPEHHEYRWATADECKYLFGPRLNRVLTWALEKINS
ncbi:NUDIX domain-containing protein [Bdellovibrio sp. HCB185ZH]|uniref:NUDIX domain-containing protein n=1 Tax=Bdellovibrio sp. HCB185ZH TaxID=3394235 RepID=UPI0039A69808